MHETNSSVLWLLGPLAKDHQGGARTAAATPPAGGMHQCVASAAADVIDSRSAKPPQHIPSQLRLIVYHALYPHHLLYFSLQRCKQAQGRLIAALGAAPMLLLLGTCSCPPKQRWRRSILCAVTESVNLQ